MEQSEIQKYIKAFEDKDQDVRERAVENLVKIGKPAVPALIEALKHYRLRDDLETAEKLSETLGDTTDEVGLLRAVRAMDAPTVRMVAAFVLGEIADPLAVPALMETLNDLDRDVRIRSANALGKIRDPSAVPSLIKALTIEMEYSNVRGAVAWALKEIGEPAVSSLFKALKDEHEDVRELAAIALGEIGEPAVPSLIKALKDKHEDVRERAAIALGEIGDQVAVPSLLEALKDEHEDVRERAAIALGEIGDQAALPALKKARWDMKKEVRVAVAEARKKLEKKG